jgi:hypothetical protein
MFLSMKKKLLLVGVIAAMGFGAFVASCDEDDEEAAKKSCNCTSSHGLSRIIDPASFGAKNCADLEIVMEAQASDNITYSCN